MYYFVKAGMQTKNKVRSNIIKEVGPNKKILDYRYQDPNQVALPEFVMVPLTPRELTAEA